MKSTYEESDYGGCISLEERLTVVDKNPISYDKKYENVS